MNIEPAILVMHHSRGPVPAITATLLDFLCRIIVDFYPAETDRVRNGIYASLNTILEKRVLPSLSPLFDNPRLDRDLRILLRELFTPYVTNLEGIEDAVSVVGGAGDDDAASGGGGAQFSDDEEDEDSSNKKSSRRSSGSSSKRRRRSSEARSSTSDKASVVELDDSLRSILDELRNVSAVNGDEQTNDNHNGDESNVRGNFEDDEDKTRTKIEKKCDLVDNLMRTIVSEQVEYEQCSLLATQLAEILKEDFEGKLYPIAANNPANVGSNGASSNKNLYAPPAPENLEDSLGRPVFVVFRFLCEMTDSDPNRGPILQLVADMYSHQPRIGYYLLYFLSVDGLSSSSQTSGDSGPPVGVSGGKKQRTPKEKAILYKDLCEAIDENYSLSICLTMDMRQCLDDDVYMFAHLVPEVFANFPKHSIGNSDLLYLVVSAVDGRQISRLISHVLAKDFVMLKKDSFQAILNASLNWETFEQYALWQIATAHDLPFDCITPIISRLTAAKHSEAITFISLRLKNEKPSAELLKHLLSREIEVGDRFVSSTLIHWINENYDEKLGDLTANHLSKAASGALSTPSIVSSSSLGSSSGSQKRKRTAASNAASITATLLAATSSNGGASGGYSGGDGGLPHAAELCLRHLDVLRTTCKTAADFFSQQNMSTALSSVKHSCSESQKRRFMDLFAMADDSDSEEEEVVSKSSSKSKQSQQQKSSKSPAKSRKGGGGGGSANSRSSSSHVNNANENSSGDSSDNEITINSKSSSSKSNSNSKRTTNSSKSSSSSGGRKRAKQVASYKISSDDSSDDDVELARKIPPKKKKKVQQNFSDSD